MYRILKQSLLTRLALAMATILGLAFSAMLASVFVAEISEGQASAINHAGSLRMQIYRLTLAITDEGQVGVNGDRRESVQHLLNGFTKHLHDPILVGVLNRSGDDTLVTQYQFVDLRWKREMQEVFQQIALEGKITPQSMKRMDEFVGSIDRFVSMLEQEAEQKLRLLRLIQIGLLFFTLPVVFWVMYMVTMNVAGPLRELLQGTDAFGKGDFSRRISYRSLDEFGQLAEAFNSMAEDISRLYGNLEQRVREKTSHLRRSNRSLEFLYRIARRLHVETLTESVCRDLLRDISQLVGVGPGLICLGEDSTSRAYTLASSRAAKEDGDADICNAPECATCLSTQRNALVLRFTNTDSLVRMYPTAIRDSEKQYGVLLMELPEGAELQVWQRRLLETVANHIAMALKASSRSSESRRLALLEERSVIARELHDSLAQALSYLKIQVARLDMLIRSEGSYQSLAEINSGLRDGLNSAYRQLRELLTTFRLRMGESGLNEALTYTVQEFRQRSTLLIELDNQLLNCPLDPSVEIHVIQVVREALVNVERHAEAKRTRISARFDSNGEVVVAIDDDGRGWPQAQVEQSHYGLAIMRERAHSLCGDIELKQSSLGGACVELRFNLKCAHVESASTDGVGGIV